MPGFNPGIAITSTGRQTERHVSHTTKSVADNSPHKQCTVNNGSLEAILPAIPKQP